MEKKYSIGLLLAAVVCLATLSFAFHVEYKYDQERARIEAEEAKRKEEEQSVSTQGNAEKAECYYLLELNGYVAVYQNDKTTVFEYTNIRLSELPQELQSEIKSGKKIETTEKLYGFLENYSS